MSGNAFADNFCPFSLIIVVPQSPSGYELFDFPLVYSTCLVTAYFESLRVFALPLTL